MSHGQENKTKKSKGFFECTLNVKIFFPLTWCRPGFVFPLDSSLAEGKPKGLGSSLVPLGECEVGVSQQTAGRLHLILDANNWPHEQHVNSLFQVVHGHRPAGTDPSSVSLCVFQSLWETDKHMHAMKEKYETLSVLSLEIPPY